MRSPPRGPRDASPNSALAVAESIFLRRKAAVKSRSGAAPLAAFRRCSSGPTRRQALPGYPARPRRTRRGQSLRPTATVGPPTPAVNGVVARPAATAANAAKAIPITTSGAFGQAGGKGEGGQVHSTQSVGGNAANAARRRWSGDRASAPSSRRRPHKAASSAPPEGRLSSRAGARKENEETLAFGLSAVVSADAYETPARDEREARAPRRITRSLTANAEVRTRLRSVAVRAPGRQVGSGSMPACGVAARTAADRRGCSQAQLAALRTDRGDRCREPRNTRGTRVRRKPATCANSRQTPGSKKYLQMTRFIHLEGFHGKERVAGSSPAEGSLNPRYDAVFSFRSGSYDLSSQRRCAHVL